MEQTDVRETLTHVADTTLDTPVTITVDILDQKRGLFTWGKRPVQRVFTIQQITLGNMIRISKLLLSFDIEIDPKIFSSTALVHTMHTILDKHGRTIAEVIAVALHNKESEPPKELVHFILYNFSSKELFNVFSIVLKQMDITSFISSIITMKGLSVLESKEKSVMSQ